MNTPEEKLIKVEGILKQLEDNLMKLNDEYEAKKAEIDGITNIKNSRLQVKNFRGEGIKEKKAFGQKFLGLFELIDAKHLQEKIGDIFYQLSATNSKAQFISYEQLEQYYNGLSIAVAEDLDFINILKNSWNIA